MGELKSFAEEQKKLLEQVKNVGRQVYLANLGLLFLLKDESIKQYGNALETARKAYGETTSNEWVLAVRGLVDQLVKEVNQLNIATVREQAQQLREKILSKDWQAQAQKVFQDLVQAGEKRKAA